jgi:hypothetical protein
MCWKNLELENVRLMRLRYQQLAEVTLLFTSPEIIAYKMNSVYNGFAAVVGVFH